MTYQTTLTDAWNNLAQLCERVLEKQDIIIITQPDGKKVALIAVDELTSLLEKANSEKQITSQGETQISKNSVPQPGLHPGAIFISDDFDEPLPDEFWLGQE